VNNVDGETAAIIDMEPYTPENFANDISRITAGRSDPLLSRILVEDSSSVVKWFARNGVRFQLSFKHQAYKVDARFKCWGALSLRTEERGKGLIQAHQAAARHRGVVIVSTPAKRLITDLSTGSISAVGLEHEGREKIIKTRAAILAAGGFEANPRMRSQ
jgi:aspartate oxidase